MATYFFDSSGVVKRYVTETGSAWVSSILDPSAGHRIYVARITAVEVVAALTRRARAVQPGTGTAAVAISQFRQEWGRLFRLVPVPPKLLDGAMSLAETHGLRAYDAVQLAAALRANGRRKSPLIFVCADVPLNAAAAAEGLRVDDPNAHP